MGGIMSNLTFTYDDFTPQGIEKYRADLQRRLIATGVIDPWDRVDIEREDFFINYSSQTTHLNGDGTGDGSGLGYTVFGDSFAIRDAAPESPTPEQSTKKKRWWRR